jgi:hypothetical protein
MAVVVLVAQAPSPVFMEQRDTAEGGCATSLTRLPDVDPAALGRDVSGCD